jgi:hypothetical protein
MGLLDKFREKKAAQEAERAATSEARATTAKAEEAQRWDAWTEELLGCLEFARNGGAAATDDEDGLISILLKKGEAVFMVGKGAALVEPRRLPGQWVGRSQGVSFRVMKGVNYRIGGSRGTFQQGEEVPTAIDTGTLTLTNQRIVFQGTRQTREWMFTKLIGFQHDEGAPITYFQVSNRQKTSGVLYDEASAPALRLRLAVALAWADGDASEVIPQLEAEMQRHRSGHPDANSSDQ